MRRCEQNPNVKCKHSLVARIQKSRTFCDICRNSKCNNVIFVNFMTSLIFCHMDLEEALLLRFSICTYVCICMHMYMCVHICVYRCMCICMYMYICMSVYMYAYTFIYMHVWVYIYTRVGAFCLFVLSNLSTTSMRVNHRCYLTPTCVCVGGLEVGFVSACSWLALVADVAGYVLAGVEIGGFVLYISLLLRVSRWCVCVCLYTRVHTNKLLGYLMWTQVWDGHLESQKNPDRRKRIIHVYCICVQSTFVYIHAGLRVLMIWANCLFFFNMSFLLRKVEDVTTISKPQSLTLVRIKDYT